jgi:hypothetical protein
MLFVHTFFFFFFFLKYGYIKLRVLVLKSNYKSNNNSDGLNEVFPNIHVYMSNAKNHLFILSLKCVGFNSLVEISTHIPCVLSRDTSYPTTGHTSKSIRIRPSCSHINMPNQHLNI